MHKFTEIIGAVLESITESNATYGDASENGELLNVESKPMAFDKGHH